MFAVERAAGPRLPTPAILISIGVTELDTRCTRIPDPMLGAVSAALMDPILPRPDTTDTWEGPLIMTARALYQRPV